MLVRQEKAEPTPAPEKTEEKTPENPNENPAPTPEQELKELAAAMLVSERAMLSWQIKGSSPAIMFAANHLRDDYRHFSPGHARIQDAIFDLHRRNERIEANAIDRTLAGSPRPEGEQRYIVSLHNGAPAVKSETDLARTLADSHAAWRKARARKEALLAPPPAPENPEPANTNEFGDIALRPASPVPGWSDCARPAQIDARDEALERVRNAPMSSAAARFEWTEPGKLHRRSFVLNGHAARRFVSGTVAPGGVGKTALVLAESLALATGTDIFQTGIEQANVWYIGLEDPLDEYRRRVAAASVLHKLDGSAIQRGFFLNVAGGNNFVMTERTSGGNEICRPVVDAILASIRENLISLVIVDPFVASHRASESDNMTIARVIRAWAHIAEESGAAVELVHHTRKRSGDEPGADDVRGASALVNAMRSVRLLVPISEAEAQEFEVYDPSRYFRIVSAKNNLSARTREPEWREFVPVDLGNASGKSTAADVVGAVRLWKPPALATEEQMEEIRERLSGGQFRLDVRAENWAGKPIAEVLGLNVRDLNDRTKVRRAIKRWTEEGVFRLQQRMDERRRLKDFIEVVETQAILEDKSSG